jgi:HK97 family phage portal protein
MKSIFGQIFSVADGEVSDMLNPAKWLSTWAGGGVSTSGEPVTGNTALGLAAYYACAHVIAEDVGKLPFKVYRRLDPRGKEVAYDHALYETLHTAPNPEMSAMSFREVMTFFSTTWGNGYAEIRPQKSGGKSELWPIHPGRVEIKRTPGDRLYYSIRQNNGTTVEIPPERMLHIHGLGDDGVQGYSVAKVACDSIGIGLAGQRLAGAFFGNGSVLSGVLETPNQMTPDAHRQLREEFERIYRGASNAAKTAILEQGLKYTKIGIPPEEAQFIESRQFQVEEVCRWFRVPPHKIQHLLRATFSNIEHQGIEYVTDTLQPWLVRWEQEVARKLFGDDPEYFAEHLIDGLLRGDSVSRSTYYHNMVFSGLMTPNEVRELENLNPMDGGDDLLVQSAMVTLASISDPKEEAPPTDNNPAPPIPPVPEPPQPPEDGNPPPTEAVRPVFLDAAARVARKETEAIGRAMDRHRGNTVRFTSWLENFFDDAHEVYIRDQFLAPAAVHLALSGTALPLESDRHVAAVKDEAATYFARSDVPAWTVAEQFRATRLADLMYKGDRR